MTDGEQSRPRGRQRAKRKKAAMSKCPTCGGDLVPIRYGFPGPEMWEAVERGEIVLGGCCISPDMPSQQCRACGATPPAPQWALPFADFPDYPDDL